MTKYADSRTRWKALLAFGVIYFVWGSTFLAIRTGVREVPPLLFAAMRFFAAGVMLYGWTMLRRERAPTAKQWISATVLGFFIFVVDYGCLFWAEQRVPSGLAAVILATIPVFMSLSEILFLRTRKLTFALSLGLLVGLAGVAVLMSRALNLGGAPVDRAGATALILAAISWSISSVLTRKLPLPESKTVSSGAQMLAGGVLLTAGAGALGEFRAFHAGAISLTVWLSLAYLIVAGSVIGYTAYLWLLHHESPTKVGTYAYVNPLVAVLVGYFFGGEGLGSRTILGTALILVSVVVITTMRSGASAPAAATLEKSARVSETA